jgi:hypothetical protein
MKKLLLILLFVGVFAVAVNDGGRLFVGKSTLRANTSTLASWAQNNAGGLKRDVVATQLVDRAKVLNVRVDQYGQDQNGIQIWTESDVTGLWVLGTYKGTLDGVPFRKAFGSPIVIKDYAAAQYR